MIKSSNNYIIRIQINFTLLLTATYFKNDDRLRKFDIYKLKSL